jgi:hypothetical protein
VEPAIELSGCAVEAAPPYERPRARFLERLIKHVFFRNIEIAERDQRPNRGNRELGNIEEHTITRVSNRVLWTFRPNIRGRKQKTIGEHAGQVKFDAGQGAVEKLNEIRRQK